MRKKTKISIVWLILLLLACKEVEYIKPTAYNNTPEGNFDAYWNGIDQNYVFFEYDKVDWDKMYQQYKPLVNSSTSKKQLFDIFAKMMTPLIDGHKKITTNDKNIGDFSAFSTDYLKKYPFISPYPENINYLDPKFIFSLKGKQSDSSTPEDEIIISIIKANNKTILYVWVLFFGDALQNLQNKNDFNQILEISQNSANNAGMVLDVRGNGGGQASAFYNLIGRFIKNEYTWGFSQIRLQRDRYAMSPLINENIKPQITVAFSKPVVVLSDRYSFSAAELTTMALKNLPNAVSIGDTTGGATGPLSDVNNYTGSFLLPNGWKIQLAQRVTLDANKNIFENTGVPPNIVVKQNADAKKNGKDVVLEYAIKYLDK